MKRNGANLTEGKPVKLILQFAIPVFLGNLFQLFYGLIDTKIVGSTLGEGALAAVGSVSILYNLLTGFFNGLTLGFSVVTARYFGAGDNEKLKKSVAGTILLGFITAAILVTGVFIFLRPLLAVMHTIKARYVWLRKENIMDIHNGKTMLTFLDSNKDYKLYDSQNRVVTTQKGTELYTHYDKVEASVRERYEKVQKQQKKTTQQKTVTTKKAR